MQKLLITAVLFIFCLGGIAQAKDKKFYFKGSASYLTTMNNQQATQDDSVAVVPEDPDASPFALKGIRDTDAVLEDGLGLSLAMGKDFGGWRGELEYSFRKNSVGNLDITQTLDGEPEDPGEPDERPSILNEAGEMKVHALMVNGYKDFKNTSSFTPYVGAGLGIAWQDYTHDNSYRNEDFPVTGFNVTTSADMPEEYSESKTALGYQFMAGVGIGLTDAIILDAGYKFFGTTSDVASHNIEAGIRYSF